MIPPKYQGGRPGPFLKYRSIFPSFHEIQRKKAIFFRLPNDKKFYKLHKMFLWRYANQGKNQRGRPGSIFRYQLVLA